MISQPDTGNYMTGTGWGREPSHDVTLPFQETEWLRILPL